MRTLFRHHLLPIAVYTILALIVLWPMPAHPATTIAGGGDGPWFLWQLWWFKRAIFQLGVSPLRTDRIYFPLADVAVQWQTPWNEAIMAPLLFGLPPTLAYNLLVVATYSLTGYGTYLLLTAITRNRTVAFAGGLLFAFGGYRNVRALGHLSLLTTQWIPFLALAGMQMWRRPNVARGLVLGVMAALVALSSPYYTGMVMLPMAIAAGLYVLITQPRRLLRREFLWASAVAAVVLLVIAAPFYVDYLRQEPEVFELTRDLGRETEALSADLLSYVLPPERNPVWALVTYPIFRELASSNAAETTLFVGVAVILLAAASLFVMRRLPRSALFWQLLALITLLLSFGPTLKFHGQTILPWMPFRLFALIPGFYSFRAPSRFGITAALALIALAAMVTAWLVRNWPARRTQAVVYAGAAIILVNSLYRWPFFTTSTVLPDFYETIRAEAGDRAVLSLPAGEYFTDEGGFDFYVNFARAMYAQTLHGKPLVSGYLGRRPERLYTFERNAPFVSRFFSRDPQQPVIDLPPIDSLPLGFLPADVRDGNDTLYNQGIGSVLLDCNALNRLCRPAYTMLRQTLGLPWADEEGVLAFRVSEPHANNLPDLLSTAAIAVRGGITPTTDLASSPFVLQASSPPYDDPAFGDGNSWRRTLAVGRGAALTVTVPLSGIWRIQGDFSGAAASDANLLVDGAPLSLTTFAAQTPAPARLFQAEIPLSAGLHTVEIIGGATSQTGEGCDVLCLSNLAVMLREPEIAQAESLVTFTDEAGRLVSLIGAQRVETRATSDAAPRTWLVTQWSVAGNDAAALLDAVAAGDAEIAPTLFVHRTDEAGTTLAQADHLLGARAAWDADRTAFLDVVELPADDDLPAGVDPALVDQLRLGLWYPQREAYFWATEPERVDAGQRFVLERDLLPFTRVAIPEAVPSPRSHATFTLEGVPVAYELLDARLADGGPFSCGQLVTTWRTEGYDLDAPFPPTNMPVNLTVHVTDADGTILGGDDRPFSDANATYLAGNRLLMTLQIPCGLAERDDVEVRLLVWDPNTGKRFDVAGEAEIDGEGRVNLLLR